MYSYSTVSSEAHQELWFYSSLPFKVNKPSPYLCPRLNNPNSLSLSVLLKEFEYLG